MKSLYSFFVFLAEKVLPFFALFNKKLNQFILGRKSVFSDLQKFFTENDKVIWFHAASLGEYEQGVPVMEAVKEKFPRHKILLTFFSPSGYEVKKNNGLAHFTTYLPLDTKKNARKFIALAHPVLAVFIKYEIWPNYLSELKNQNIETLLISGLFRESQPYFKPFGGFMRKALKNFDHFFVQDQTSKDLLESRGFKNITISGDTRFDRVSHQIEHDNRVDFISEFKSDKLCVVFGSTWPEDEAVFVDYINNSPDKLQFIIAPHAIKQLQINNLKQKIKKPTLLYSEITNKNLSNNRVLIIDRIGLLGKIYSYADIAYVGGAMGKLGLHNILEPATFGLPIIIGKNFEKFPEAKRLQSLAGLFSVKNQEEFTVLMDKLFSDRSFREKTGMISGHFIQANTGAAQIITKYLGQNFKK